MKDIDELDKCIICHKDFIVLEDGLCGICYQKTMPDFVKKSIEYVKAERYELWTNPTDKIEKMIGSKIRERDATKISEEIIKELTIKSAHEVKTYFDYLLNFIPDKSETSTYHNGRLKGVFIRRKDVEDNVAKILKNLEVNVIQTKYPKFPLNEVDTTKRAKSLVRVRFDQSRFVLALIMDKKVIKKVEVDGDVNNDSSNDVIIMYTFIDGIKYDAKQVNKLLDWGIENKKTFSEAMMERNPQKVFDTLAKEYRKSIEVKKEPYSVVKERLTKYGIKSKKGYIKAINSGKLKGFSKTPDKEFKGFNWNDYLSIGQKKKQKVITQSKVDRAISMLKKNSEFYMRQSAGWLINCFEKWGLLDASDKYRRQFFNSFTELYQTPEGRKQIMEILATGRFDMISSHITHKANKSPIKSYFVRKYTETSDITGMKKKLFLETEELGVNKILSEADDLIPMDENTEVFWLHVRTIVLSLWKEIFDDTKEGTNARKILTRNVRTKLGRAVIKQFSDEYHNAIRIFDKIMFAGDYRGKSPNMMQLYTAMRVKKLNGFCNFSKTGAGKTLASIITSRICNAKATLIVCPNNIKEQWKRMILECYPLAKVTMDKMIFGYGLKPYAFHIVNYEKFSRGIADIIIKETGGRIDMIILDEVQQTKQRIETDNEILDRVYGVSKKRQAIMGMLEKIRKEHKMKMLVMTATPIINNLTEGKKLLEMVAGKEFPHLKTSPTIRNGARLHTEFLEYALRYIKKYNIDKNEIIHRVTTTFPTTIPPETLREYSWNDYERHCTKARIPKILEILKKTNGRAIIYTKYVTGIVDEIQNALESAGYKTGLFTGDDKTGMKLKTELKINGKRQFRNPFQEGDLCVLIASSPIAEGVDGLQDICNTLIFNGLPWTYAEFEQVTGRLVRTGQNKNVTVHLILADILNDKGEIYEYDEKVKRNRLYVKEMLMACVIDGIIPDATIFKKQKSELKNLLNHILKYRRTYYDTYGEKFTEVVKP